MAIEITPTGTNLQIAKDDKFKEILNDQDNSTYRLEQAFVQDELPFGKTLYARVRHNAKETGYSKWSKVVTFHVEVPAMIIGIAIDNSQSPSTVHYIDMDGNQLTDPDLANHAAFKGISMVEMDTARSAVTMTKFPKFFIKTAASGPVGTFSEGKTCYWISDLEFEGFRPHPAFKRSTEKVEETGKFQVNDYVYIGTYAGHYESISGSGGVLGSKKGQTVATGSSSYTRSNLLSYCRSRNNTSAGESGWHPYDIWDLSLLQWLGVFWKGSFNFQSSYGTNSSSSPSTGSTECRLVFRGTQSSPEVWIDDLWSTYWQHIDLISHSSGTVSLTSPMDGSSNISIGGSSSDYTMSTSSGYVKTFCSAPFVLGDDSHDLLELFLPKTVVGSESSSLAPDYYNYSTDTSYLKVGGYWSNSSQGGLFSLHSLNEVYQESYQSYEVIRYDQSYWPKSRRCEYIIFSGYEYPDTMNMYPEWYNVKTYTGDVTNAYELKSKATIGNYMGSNGNFPKCSCPNAYDLTTNINYAPFVNNGRNYRTGLCCDAAENGGIYYVKVWHKSIRIGEGRSRWIERRHTASCPKGWGPRKADQSASGEQVYCGAGKTASSTSIPVYGYVTKYRDVYYNYLGGRISKS